MKHSFVKYEKHNMPEKVIRLVTPNSPLVSGLFCQRLRNWCFDKDPVLDREFGCDRGDSGDGKTKCMGAGDHDTAL